MVGLGAAVDALAGAAWWRLGEDDLVTSVRQVEVAQRRLDAARLALVREVETRGVAASRAMTDTASWWAHTLQLRPDDAANLVKTAATLSRSLAPTA